MENRQRYFFGKREKLKSRKAITGLFEKGFRFSHMPYRIFCHFADSGVGLQAGIGASSRNLKKATDRNRVKRLMREAYRLQKNELQQHLAKEGMNLQVFFLFTGKTLPSQEAALEDFNKILNRLIRLSDEKFKTLS